MAFFSLPKDPAARQCRTGVGAAGAIAAAGS